MMVVSVTTPSIISCVILEYQLGPLNLLRVVYPSVLSRCQSFNAVQLDVVNGGNEDNNNKIGAGIIKPDGKAISYHERWESHILS